MIIKVKKFNVPTTFLSNESCNDPTVKLVAQKLITYVIENPENPCITYKELSQLCENKIHHRNLDEPLGEISNLCSENGLPLISSVVYNKNENRPGSGFFKYFFPQLSEKDWDKEFVKCVKQVKACKKWKEFIKIFD